MCGFEMTDKPVSWSCLPFLLV